jgi:ribonuclease D
MTSATQPLDAAFEVYLGDLPLEVAEGLRASGRIAWDIETTGLDWGSERIALCQVYASRHPVAIVRINEAIPVRLASLLTDPNLLKVFHHAMFDVRFMSHAWSVEAACIACTKIAAKVLFPGEPDRHSLRSLAGEILGVTLDKSEQLSDWTAAVHSARQLRYASNDVLHLARLLDALTVRLRAQGLDKLAQRCFDHIPTRVALELGGFGDVFTY